MELVKYDAACRAVAEAKSIDDVKDITNRAAAARAYARQAKNKQLELDALEIRVRAERRLGQIIIDMKKQGVIKVQGVREYTERGKTSPIGLRELDINGNISSIAQRLASLPQNQFEQEMIDWRLEAETRSQVQVPLQSIRLPTLRADRQRAASRAGRVRLDQSDPFAKFISPDGRRVADWRAGELQRIETLFCRAANCARILREQMPLANPDSLATMEMIFDLSNLEELLTEIWSEEIIAESKGLQTPAIEASRTRRTRICEHCNKKFIMNPRGNSAGRFCSQECSIVVQRNHKKAN